MTYLRNAAGNTARRDYFDYLILLALVVVVSSFLIRETIDADTWWQVAIGRDVLANLSVPGTDHFALAAWGRPYHDSHWLFQVLLAISDNIAGMWGVSLVMVFLWSATFYFSFKSVRLWLPGFASAIFIFCALIACLDRFTPRPDLITCLMIALYYYLLQKNSFLSTRLLAVFAVLQVIWTNSHGLFVIGPFMVLCYLFAALLKHLKGSGNPDFTARLKLTGVVILSSLISPFGINGWKYSFLLAQEAGTVGHEVFKDLPELISLFDPSVWKHYDFWAFMFVLACFLTILVYSAYKAQIPFDRFLIVAGLLICAASGRRNIPLFVLAAVPYIAENINKFSLLPLVPNWFKAIIAAAMILLSWFPLSGKYYESIGYPARFGMGASPSFYPEGLPRYLKQINFTGNIYNSGSLGGFALYHGYIPLSDGRWEVYDGKVLSWLFRVPFSDVEFEKMRSRYEVKGLLLQHSSPEAVAILPKISKGSSWKLVYADMAASFWVYSASGVLPLETYLPQILIPDRVESYLMVADFYRLTGKKEVAFAIIQKAVTKGHQTVSVLEQLGRLQTELGLMAEAERTYKKITVKDSKNINALNELAFLAYSKGDLNSAENYLVEALQINREDTNTIANYRRIMDAKSGMRPAGQQR